MQMRTDSPVWEQGYTFLVSNPENDTLQLKVMDQKTQTEIGRHTYIIAHLMEKKNMEIVTQPFALQKSGPESKLIMSLSLRVLKKADIVADEEKEVEEKDKEEQPPKSPLKKQDSKISRTSVKEATIPAEEQIVPTNVSSSQAAPPSPTASRSSDREAMALERNPSIRSMSSETGPLGAINITLQYSVQRQRLIIIIHRIKGIPLKDPNNIPDPYVKLYLLPGRNKDSKRKTNVIKDNCNPVFDATFEYLISTAELHTSSLEVTVATQKMIGSPILGMIKIELNQPDVVGAGKNAWYDLMPEFKSTDL